MSSLLASFGSALCWQCPCLLRLIIRQTWFQTKIGNSFSSEVQSNTTNLYTFSRTIVLFRRWAPEGPFSIAHECNPQVSRKVSAPILDTCFYLLAGISGAVNVCVRDWALQHMPVSLQIQKFTTLKCV